MTAGITFNEVGSEWLEENSRVLRQQSFEAYRIRYEKFILPFFSGRSFADMKPSDISAFAGYLCDMKLSKNYIMNIFGVLKSITRSGSLRHDLPDPASGVDIGKNLAGFNSAGESGEIPDEDALFEKIQRICLLDVNFSKLGILVALYTGIKIGELCALKWSDIDTENRAVSINRTIQRVNTGDGHTEVREMPVSLDSFDRKIQLPEKLCKLLERHRGEPGFYLLSGRGKPYEPRRLQYQLTALLEENGIKNVTFNTLRRLYSKKSAKLGMDVISLKRSLGYSWSGRIEKLYV